jgi:hypothetical protein
MRDSERMLLTHHPPLDSGPLLRALSSMLIRLRIQDPDPVHKKLEGLAPTMKVGTEPPEFLL